MKIYFENRHPDYGNQEFLSSEGFTQNVVEGHNVNCGRDTETPRHRDTETPRHRDTETPRHRDTETP